MRILDFRTFEGPNVWTNRPVLRMNLDLEELAETTSADLEGFVDRLIALLPGLEEHRCSRGYRGGFIERLREGTYFGHIVEHVALELSGPAGIEVGFGRTISGDAPGVYQVIVAYKSEAGMKKLLEHAVRLVEAVIRGEGYPIEQAVAEAKRIASRTALGPSTRAIVEAAERRGIPYRRLNEGSLVQLGYGRYRKLLQATTLQTTSFVGVDVAGDKALCKQILEAAGLPVPNGQVVSTPEAAVAAFEALSGPVVLKPIDGRQGKGVSTNVRTPDEVREAFAIAAQFSDDVIVEEMIVGRNYRVVVVGGRVVAASERLAAHVVGDGVHTVRELIDIENRNPMRGEGHDAPLTQLEVDEVVRAYLSSRGRSLDEVPAKGERFFLRESANLSTGGIARDVTDLVHPETRVACERAARAIELDVCGIDLIMPDIARPITEGGAILELNAAPGIRMHHHPSEGQPRDVGAAIVELLYPPGAPSRIPIVAITGTNGKTTTARLTAHVLEGTGLTVGLTTTDGIFIGGHLIKRGDMTGRGSAQTVLSDPTVDVAVLETARGGIVRRGLGYDGSDVGVLTNIQADHLGQDGIETLEDLLHVKSVVAERVREGGTLVVNAEDDHLAAMLQIPRIASVERELVLFALDPRTPRLQDHLARGGRGLFYENGWIVEAQGGHVERLIRAATLSWTFHGAAGFQIANAMAAIGACRSQGVPASKIAQALARFDSVEDNPGRANLYRVGQGYVLVDFGHNPGSFAAVCEMARRWSGRRVTGIVAVPGDRSDVVVDEAARTAARGFHRVFFREDADTRGRAPGEVANRMAQVARAEVPGVDVHVMLAEEQALEAALATMTPGEVIVVFYDDRGVDLELLERHGARPVSDVQETQQVRRSRTSFDRVSRVSLF